MDDPLEDAEGAQSSKRRRCTLRKAPSRNASQETNRSTDSDFVDARSKTRKAAAIKSTKPVARAATKPVARTATKPVPTVAAEVRPPSPPHFFFSWYWFCLSIFFSFFCVPFQLLNFMYLVHCLGKNYSVFLLSGICHKLNSVLPFGYLHFSSIFLVSITCIFCSCTPVILLIPVFF